MRTWLAHGHGMWILFLVLEEYAFLTFHGCLWLIIKALKKNIKLSFHVKMRDQPIKGHIVYFFFFRQVGNFIYQILALISIVILGNFL